MRKARARQGREPGAGGETEESNMQSSSIANGSPNTQADKFFRILGEAFPRIRHCAIHFTHRARNGRIGNKSTSIATDPL
jgi:hypothetical protein